MRIYTFPLVFILFFAAAFSHKEGAKPQAGEKYVAHVEYGRLAEYINDDRHPPAAGEEFVVEGVPLIGKIGRADETGGKAFKGLFWLTADDESNVNTSFYAGAALADALRPKLGTRADHLRVECVLVEVSGAMESYRSPFATAVEAVGADAKILWRVTGARPKGVRIHD